PPSRPATRHDRMRRTNPGRGDENASRPRVAADVDSNRRMVTLNLPTYQLTKLPSHQVTKSPSYQVTKLPTLSHAPTLSHSPTLQLPNSPTTSVYSTPPAGARAAVRR